MRNIHHQRRRYSFGESFKGQEENNARRVINVQTRKPLDTMYLIRKYLPWAVLAGVVYYLVDTYVFS
ncbi:MAG: hypothetical protein H6581_04260 [Bacteroidia bacterium]|nr:hypothetical protein [Bacteroidia bacterium]